MEQYSNIGTALQVLEEMKKLKDQAAGHSVQFAQGSDMEIDATGIRVKGFRVGDRAATGLLETMQVKKGFIRKVGPGLESWEEIKDALYSLFNGKTLAMHVKGDVIQKIKTVDQPYSPAMYEEVTEQLSQSIGDIYDRKIVLSNVIFGNGELSLQFVNDTEMELLPGDAWKTGQMVTIDPFGIKLEPYMMRLVCANGAVAPVKTGEYNILHGENANMLFKKKIGIMDRKVVDDLRDGLSKAKIYNASLNEFYKYRDYFTEHCANSPQVQRALSNGELFDDTRILEAYGNLAAFSDRWLATADSGVNAYDLINGATYMASRPVEFGMEASAALGIQRMASKSLLGNLDMVHVAPKIKFN